MNWFLAILISALIYIGIDYGRVIRRARRIEAEYSPYTPQRLLFFASEEGQHIADLYRKAMQARERAGDNIRLSFNREGYICTVYESGDELRFYSNGESLEKLTKHEIEDYENRVFFDYKLPLGAIRAIIGDLGLRNYMFSFGICDESQGENNG